MIAGLLAAGLGSGQLSAGTLRLDYSTYLGGWNDDQGHGIILGSDGRTYIVGVSKSYDFPTENPYQAIYGGGGWWDAFVTALDSSGSALYYSTYLGGSNSDIGNGIALGSDGRAYVTGYTNSSDFPTEKPYQAVWGESNDAFVVALDSSGSAISYSTYLGGGGDDTGNGISLGMDGAVYVTGKTDSSDFPTKNSYQAVYGGGLHDAFVTALDPSGSALSYSTYLGGGGDDTAYGISLGTDGSAYVAGYTSSSDFPTENSYQAVWGGSNDAFVTALDPSGSTLYYSTYLGGGGDDTAYGISLGTDGRAYIAGYTSSSNFPTKNPYQAVYGGGEDDAFVTTLDSSGAALSYSTYLGGSGSDKAYGITPGTDGRAYVVGSTSSSDFPTDNPYQASYGGNNSDAFVTALDSSGSALSYSTYLGGNRSDNGKEISLGTDGKVYVVGYTFSSDFPTNNPYQAGRNGVSTDAFVSKLGMAAPSWIYDYNGDGTSDIAVFRGDSGLWAIRGITRVYFGGSSDKPIPGDYDGDGITEIGIFRPASGLWAIRGVTRAYFGGSTDAELPGDYDGDGTWDFAIFRETSGLWAIRGITRAYFGGSEDSPAPGYYDGDGAENIGIFRGSTGLWAIRDVTRVYFGSSLDTIVPGDYDGDGAWEAGIFRETSGLWAIRGVTRVYFGGSTDEPVPADYDGDGIDDTGVFRDTSGLWAARGVSRIYFGAVDDIPVTR